MKRKITKELLAWKTADKRKPLALHGARQTGKTFSVLEFAKSNYQNLVSIDFSAQRDIAAVFDGDIMPHALLPQLQARQKTMIEPGKTLLFFDEVQACPRALTSLKYFYEQAPEYHVIAAGSLLGVALGREEYSYPVGKVDALMMKPLDFEEYLWAAGEKDLAELIRQAYQENRPFGLHDYAIRLYRDYLYCGGMPEVVKMATATARTRGLPGALPQEVRRLQGLITESYLADMTKYASPLDSTKILNVWRGIPEQLAKENHKFQYTTIASSARAHQYEAPINWLKAAGLVEFCYRVSEGVAPLRAFMQQDFFKLYLLDVGLLTSLYNAEPADLEPSADKASRFRAGIAENFVMQQLIAAGIEPFYWGVPSKSEVEFVIRSKSGCVIPIEVKSGRNVGARSLEAYRIAHDPDYIIRCSTKNFGFENRIKSVPLYAAYCID
ncbi:MAG: ATP-binding protein [Coriobacteriales bacterium]|jgi:predicted AAA+ superfamily ATPase|nr:ATP-binding protein [Coriobacteriales bacterium]